MNQSVDHPVSKSRPVRLFRSWILRGFGWFTLTEAFARLLFEGAFVLLLFIAGLRLEAIVLAWLAFHTAAWLLLYGGFLGVYNLAGLERDVPRLRRYRDSVCEVVRSKPFYRRAFLYGSGARDEMTPRSDIDIMVVPGRSVISKVHGILFLWRLRMAAALWRLPLEATWADTARYLPYFMKNETVTSLTGPSHERDVRGASRGILIALSSASKEWTEGAADRLASTWRLRGLSTVVLHALGRGGRRFSIEGAFNWTWFRLGLSMDDLGRYPRMKAIRDLSAWIDYAGLAWRLSVLLRPQSIVVAEGYLVDTIARLRSEGPVSVTVEGMFVGLSFEPDASLLLVPTTADVPEAGRDHGGPVRPTYPELGKFFGLTSVSTGRSLSALCEEVERLLTKELGIELDSNRGGWRSDVPGGRLPQ